MTKPLNPEIKSMRAIARELEQHDDETQERMLARRRTSFAAGCGSFTRPDAR